MTPKQVRFHIGTAWIEPQPQRRPLEALVKKDDEGTVYSITDAGSPPDNDTKELD